MGYQRAGRQLSALLDRDFGRYAPEILSLTLGSGNIRLPTTSTFMAGSSTGSMMGLSGWVQYILGDHLLASSVLFGVASLLGKLTLYHAFRARMPVALARPALFGCLLVPSVVFWSCGVLKESVAMAALGPTVFGLVLVLERKPMQGALLVFVGSFVIFLIKPYILVALAGAGALWLVSSRAAKRRRALRGRDMILGAGAAVIGVLLIGELVPQFAVGNLGSALDRLQSVGERTHGGSNFSLGGADATLLGQMALAPLALLTSLFRPFPFETGGSPLVALGALETLVLSWFFVRGLSRNGVQRCVRYSLSNPELLFAATFVLLFGVAVGLASSNFGTLARYRIPMLPFFVFMVLSFNRPGLGGGGANPDPAESRA